MTPLAEKLRRRIAADGPMTVADYMAACLGDPEFGYYLHRDPFGRGGDFITAPEVSQMFGELVGAWMIAAWERIGAPAPFILAELGPGRGTLIADILRTAAIRPAFREAAQVHLVETSPRLREAQRAALAGAAATWHDRVEALPPGPLLLLANEFFDALPVRQFVRTGDGWAERMVGLAADGTLAFGLRPVEPPSPSFRRKPASTEVAAVDDAASSSDLRWTPAFAGVTAGDGPPVYEISPASVAIMATIAGRIARDGGAALIIDYGHEGPAFGDTLQAVRAHRYDPPLAHPGEADITAHVDFAALAEAARRAGVLPRPLVAQGAFLQRLGLAERAERLAHGKDQPAREAIHAAAERLAGPEAMGDLFKVLAISTAGLALPLFDDDVR